MRWLERFIDKRLPPLVELALAASALAELRHGTETSGSRRSNACSTACSRNRFCSMRLYALVEAGDPEAIDVYLCEEDAQHALEDCLLDEPQWRGILRVEEVEFSAEVVSPN